MGKIPSKPVVTNQPWINGVTKLNHRNLTNGINQNISNIKTAVDGVIDALGGPGADPKNLEEITWTNLKALRDTGQLVPGKQYRITDYECTTVTENTSSAGHPFDIIVTANDDHTLNENARAILHEGDTDYFGYQSQQIVSAEWLDGVTISDIEFKALLTEDLEVHYADDDMNETSLVITQLTKLVNQDGIEVPAMLNPDPNDSGNECYYVYVGTFELEDITYDMWQEYYPNKDKGYTNDYHLTNILVSAELETTVKERSKVSAWQLKYSLDNDPSRFAWADATNGKGVIYRMIDEFGNDLPYDFKNILFTVNEKYTNAYTFTYTKGSVLYDASILANKNCYNNVIKEFCSSKILRLNRNVFYSTTDFFSCYSNTFGSDCHDNTFGSQCYSNHFDADCYSNTFGYNCYFNSFGTNCFSNTFGDSCYSIVFGTNCNSNTFGNHCDSNHFDADCYSNTFGNNCNINTFGSDCHFNTFGDSCYSNTFGYNCESNHFDSSCAFNIFGVRCSSNVFGKYCDNNNFVAACSSNTFGDSCDSNTFGDSCDSNTFGNNCGSTIFGIKCSNNTFVKSCHYNVFGDQCSSNAFSERCSYNIFGHVVHHNTFSNDCSTNTFGDSCCYETFGEKCSTNTFGIDCYNNTFGINCSHNTFGDNCSYNVVGSVSEDSYVKYCIYESGVEYTFLTSPDTPSNNNYLQNVHLHLSVKGASTSNRLVISVPRNLPYETEYYLDNLGNLTVSNFSTKITWSDLKALRDASQLVPGKQYRITDYMTTTAKADTRSAGHQFDVIVRALAANKLSEEAYAALHAGDTYFANSKLGAWKLWYSIDNDTNRFDWADATNGKGVIYRMIDEFKNDLPYDFKNIQFKRYKGAIVTERGTLYPKFINMHDYYAGLEEEQLANQAQMAYKMFHDKTAGLAKPNVSSFLYSLGTKGYAMVKNLSAGLVNYLTASSHGALGNDDYVIAICGEEDHEGYLCVLAVDSSTPFYFYTFSDGTRSSSTGAITSIADQSLDGGVYLNVFEGNGSSYSLESNIFIGNTFCNNTIGNDFANNTVVYSFSNNTVGAGFEYNTMGNGFHNNIIGDYFSRNTVGDNFSDNTVGTSFNYNVVGDIFRDNTVGTSFNYNVVGNAFEDNSVKNYFSRNIVEYSFNSNIVRNHFIDNVVGKDFENNNMEDVFSSNTVGDHFNYNVVGHNFTENTVGDYFGTNSVGSEFRYNIVGSYICYSSIKDGTYYITLDAPSGSSSNKLQYITIGPSIHGASSSNRLAITPARNVSHEQEYVNADKEVNQVTVS